MAEKRPNATPINAEPLAGGGYRYADSIDDILCHHTNGMAFILKT